VSIPQKEDPRLKRELDNLVLQMHAAGVGYTDAVREFKKQYILEVLSRHRGNQCKAAEELGMHRNTLSRTLSELGMDSTQIRQGMRRPPTSVRPARATRPNLQIISGGR
jgi:Fis family transcriptional regulator